MCKAPGRSHRKGLTLLQVEEMFADEEKARAWIEGLRGLQGPCCPHCVSSDVQRNIKHKSQDAPLPRVPQ